MGEGDWGGEKFGVEGRRGLWDGDSCTLFCKVVSSLVAILARVGFDPVESNFVGFIELG